MGNVLELPLPPNEPQAEAGVIGGLLLDNTKWPEVSNLLTFADFYQKKHQIIFRAIAQLMNAGDPADVITVHERIQAKGLDEAAGGLQYIGTLAKDTPSASNIATYARIVRDKSTKRRLLMVAQKIKDLALDAGIEAKDALAQSERDMFELSQRDLRGKRGPERLDSILRELLDRMEQNMTKPESGVLGVPSGFQDLDGLVGGFKGGDFIILAARPSMGKSALALQLAERGAIDGKPVAFFSMEMPSIQFGERILASNSNVFLSRIRSSWMMADDDWSRLTTGMQKISDLPLYIDDTPGLSLSEVRARSMKLNLDVRMDYPDGVGMIVIDYLQLMQSENDYGGNLNVQIQEITRGLKRLAKELDIPIVALSQLNRSLEGRANKRPVMSDLRDSGSIEQDADVVLFIYRDEVYNQDSPDAGIAEIIIGKQRNGPLGTVRLSYDGPSVRFRDLFEPRSNYADRFSR